MATRAEFRQHVRRNLGHPMVKVELCDDHIDDAINRARDMWIKWAVGNATQERWMTILLKGGQYIYDLPSGVVEVVDYRDEFGGMSGGGGSNHTYSKGGPQELFTLDNAMYMGGFLNANQMGSSYGGGLNAGYGGGGFNGSAIGGGGGFNFIGYELAKQAIGTIEHYQYNSFIWYYHRSTNQLELQPRVQCGNTLTITTSPSGHLTLWDNDLCPYTDTIDTVVDSPGFVLLRTYMVEGSPLPTYTPPTSGETPNSIFHVSDNYSEYMFNEVWLIEYATALSMITLGRIRSKFSGFSALGNTGIDMDGSDLISEGKEDKTRLEEELDLKHSYDGYGIVIG